MQQWGQGMTRADARSEAQESLYALVDVIDALSEPDASGDLLTQAQILARIALAAVCRIRKPRT